METKQEEGLEENLEEIQDRIENLERMTKDNNKILHKMQNHIRMGTVMSVIYWTVIIGSMLGIYYYFQPFIEEFLKTYKDILAIPEKIKDLGKQGF